MAKDRYTKINLTHKNKQKITNIKKASTQKAPEKYPITECFNVLRSLWAKPEHEQLIITTHAWCKLMAYIHLIGDYEISGFGRIEQRQDKDGNPLTCITDFAILKQTVQGAYVESDADAVMDFIRRVPADQRDEWTLDWHSHVNMATSPSGTDWTNYTDMLTARMGKQFPAMIVNKKGEVTAHQIINETRHPSIKILVEKTELDEQTLQELYAECKHNVETLCTKKHTTSYYGANNKTSVGYYSWKKQDDYDDDDDEVIEAKKQGYVFDDTCDICGEPLVTTWEKKNACCTNCYRQWYA